MEATPNMKLDTLRARIARSDYEVDADAVAEAIVRRLMAGRRDVAQGTPPVEGGSLGASAVEAG